MRVPVGFMHRGLLQARRPIKPESTSMDTVKFKSEIRSRPRSIGATLFGAALGVAIAASARPWIAVLRQRRLDRTEAGWLNRPAYLNPSS
jgi:hypothetical protein